MEEKIKVSIYNGEKDEKRVLHADPIGFKHEMTLVYLMLRGVYDKEKIDKMGSTLPVNRKMLPEKISWKAGSVKRQEAVKVVKIKKVAGKWVLSTLKPIEKVKYNLPKIVILFQMEKCTKPIISKMIVTSVNSRWVSEGVDVKKVGKVKVPKVKNCYQLPAFSKCSTSQHPMVLVNLKWIANDVEVKKADKIVLSKVNQSYKGPKLSGCLIMKQPIVPVKLEWIAKDVEIKKLDKITLPKVNRRHKRPEHSEYLVTKSYLMSVSLKWKREEVVVRKYGKVVLPEVKKCYQLPKISECLVSHIFLESTKLKWTANKVAVKKFTPEMSTDIILTKNAYVFLNSTVKSKLGKILSYPDINLENKKNLKLSPIAGEHISISKIDTEWTPKKYSSPKQDEIILPKVKLMAKDMYVTKPVLSEKIVLYTPNKKLKEVENIEIHQFKVTMQKWNNMNVQQPQIVPVPVCSVQKRDKSYFLYIANEMIRKAMKKYHSISFEFIGILECYDNTEALKLIKEFQDLSVIDK